MIKTTSLVFATWLVVGMTSSANAGTLGIGAGTGVGAGAGLGVSAQGVQINTGIEANTAGHVNAKNGSDAKQEKELASATGQIREQSAVHTDGIEKARVTARTAGKASMQGAADATRGIATGVQKQANVAQKTMGSVTPSFKLDGETSGSVKAAAQ